MRTAPREQGDYIFEGNARGAAAKAVTFKILLTSYLLLLTLNMRVWRNWAKQGAASGG